ncbi:ABC transporter ATP-binding protein [Cytobacillus sp. IB215316]|uniref:ABC transporter ATP-binding protein n=1 Tax=Cytobacillus sp. IB215316 TaxID=3097354 RepID=UPI002A0F874A|nr:ABC transporter ATP-binding protein [Cytobacillus sp. IB215316]MDX8362325.1 ABC transporter ATP-binding protein [Cytobacillus sp. IB215316]
MIELQNVTKKYIGKTALHNVSLSFPEGKIIGIIGENGSGKSTLLKLMAGLIQPSQGFVKVGNMQADRRICHVVTYLSELDDYYPFYTVKQTIEFFATQFEDFQLSKAFEIMKFMKLDPNQKVKHLSKGNRGRLKIVLSLARDVPYILMDEPFSGLDPMVRESVVKGLISFINLEKQTVIITTHEVDEVEPLLDTVVVLRDGNVVNITDVEHLHEEKHIGIVDYLKSLHEPKSS